MNKFKVEYSRQARKQLRKLDRFQAALIIAWIDEHLVNTEDPYRHGKGLIGDRSREKRYRVGDYRIICVIENQRVTIHFLEIGHRRDIYDR